MKHLLSVMVGMGLLHTPTSLAAEPGSPTNGFAFESRDGAIAISFSGQRVADYVYRDEKIPRPYFANLCAPGGIQVTRNHPPVAGQDPTDHDILHPVRGWHSPTSAARTRGATWRPLNTNGSPNRQPSATAASPSPPKARCKPPTVNPSARCCRASPSPRGPRVIC
jgi:hypothetical protein